MHICVTTNGVIKYNGELVMGAGVAKQFYNKYPGIAKVLANKLCRGEVKSGVIPAKNNICYKCVEAEDNLRTYVVSFPTKNNYKDKSDIELIKQSARRLRHLADIHKLNKIIIPSPGTGCGNLKEEDVYKELNQILDNRFYIIKK